MIDTIRKWFGRTEQEAESEATVTRMFHDATREAAPSAIFVPAEKPGEGDFFTHCVDLMIAPAPESMAHAAIRRGVFPVAGCDEAGLLAHLRKSGTHCRGCWALDRLTGALHC